MQLLTGFAASAHVMTALHFFITSSASLFPSRWPARDWLRTGPTPGSGKVTCRLFSADFHTRAVGHHRVGNDKMLADFDPRIAQCITF